MKNKWYWKVTLSFIAILLTVLAAREVKHMIHDYRLEHTDIPKLYFIGDISGMKDKSDVRRITVQYVDGDQVLECYAEIKVQGTSSLRYDKKNYTVSFFKDQFFENKMEIDVGWGAQSKYCMKANWIDRTHARNVVTAKLASKVQSKYDILTQAPRNGLIDGFPVEIFDNGTFHGLYTFNIPKDSWQFNMDENNPDHIVICGEGWEPANLFEAMPDFDTWAVEVGEESEDTLKKMNRLFDFVINSSDKDFKDDFEQYINLDSALNYYVMTDLAYMVDNRGKNMLIATFDGLEWYLSLYDLDTSWGTYWDGQSLYDYESEEMDMSYSKLFARMEKAFSKELALRYFELRDDILSNESIMKEFYCFEEQIPDGSFKKERFRWSPHHNFLREALPGADYDQIEHYLDTVSDRLDAKYSAWLE